MNIMFRSFDVAWRREFSCGIGCVHDEAGWSFWVGPLSVWKWRGSTTSGWMPKVFW